MSHGKIEVRGYTSFNRPASPIFKHLALFTDFWIVLFLGAGALKLMGVSPTPGTGFLGLFVPISAVYVSFQRTLLKTTMGERIWQIKHKKTSDDYKYSLFQRDHISQTRIVLSGLMVAVSAVLAFTTFNAAVLKHPIWNSAPRWRLMPFTPSEKEWLVAPFFYASAGWPRAFDGKTIYYSLAYKKGPPSHFVERIMANWSSNRDSTNSSEVNLTIEGPRTLTQLGNQSRIRECFSSLLSYSCLAVRDTLLSRPIEEAQAINPEKWTIKWFNVENPLIPAEEQAQGVYVHAEGKGRAQDRFIVVNSEGSQQTIILSRPRNPHGDIAFDLLLKSIGSMRIYGEINSGRDWVNRQLEVTQLDPILKSKDPGLVLSKLSEIQSLLISRISVLPQSLDAYFHLNGTSLILLKNSLTASTGSVDDHSDTALQNIQNSYKYAMDIAPDDPRTNQMRKIWEEANQLLR